MSFKSILKRRNSKTAIYIPLTLLVFKINGKRRRMAKQGKKAVLVIK